MLRKFTYRQRRVSWTSRCVKPQLPHNATPHVFGGSSTSLLRSVPPHISTSLRQQPCSRRSSDCAALTPSFAAAASMSLGGVRLSRAASCASSRDTLAVYAASLCSLWRNTQMTVDALCALRSCACTMWQMRNDAGQGLELRLPVG